MMRAAQFLPPLSPVPTSDLRRLFGLLRKRGCTSDVCDSKPGKFVQAPDVQRSLNVREPQRRAKAPNDPHNHPTFRPEQSHPDLLQLWKDVLSGRWQEPISDCRLYSRRGRTTRMKFLADGDVLPRREVFS